jgi:hypothetical protein
LKEKVIVPDVLLQPHNASLEFIFYQGRQFPAAYNGDIFASEHGSWNKAVRVGYEVCFPSCQIIRAMVPPASRPGARTFRTPPAQTTRVLHHQPRPRSSPHGS